MRTDRECLERRTVLARDTRAQAVEQALQLPTVRHVKAIEQRTVVAGNRTRELAGFERAPKVAKVGGHYGWIEMQIPSLGEERIDPQRPSRGVNQLVHRVTRPHRVALGPEKRLDALARQSTAIGRGKQRQQSEPALLRRFGRDSPARRMQCESPKDVQF